MYIPYNDNIATPIIGPSIGPEKKGTEEGGSFVRPPVYIIYKYICILR
jgi:hypothetical protein